MMKLKMSLINRSDSARGECCIFRKPNMIRNGSDADWYRNVPRVIHIMGSLCKTMIPGACSSCLK
jgi:hypothetical protein